MCIILTCEQNIRPTHELLDTCFWNNPDGAGIMWCEDGRVQTAKGFMDLETLEDAIESVPTNSRLVIHMRIATSGGVNIGTCHPFPVCDKLDVLHAANTKCDAAIAHNGVIAHMPTNDKLGISDTVSFVIGVVNELYHSMGVTKSALRRMKNAAPGNRFALMTNDGKVYRLGSGWNTVTKGIQASNKTWRYEKWTYSIGGKWDTVKFNKSIWDYYYGLDDDELYELEDMFDFLCADCKQKGTCIAYGAQCEEVDDQIEDWIAWKSEQYESELDEQLVLVD